MEIWASFRKHVEKTHVTNRTQSYIKQIAHSHTSNKSYKIAHNHTQNKSYKIVHKNKIVHDK